MPPTRFLGDTSFGPDEIVVLVSAYESAMRELDLPGPTAPGAETLAMTIIRFAKQGERDPVRLRERAIDALSRLPPEAAGA
jgi:hypothetical protein